VKFAIDPVDYMPAFRCANGRRMLAAKLAEWLIAEAGENNNRTSRDLGDARKAARYLGSYIESHYESAPIVRQPVAKLAVQVCKTLWQMDHLENQVQDTCSEIALMSPYVYDLMREQQRARALSPELGDAVESALDAKEVEFAKQMIHDFVETGGKTEGR
jgi:hypothetical protein